MTNMYYSNKQLFMKLINPILNQINKIKNRPHVVIYNLSVELNFI